VHPEVLNCYLEGALVKTLEQQAGKDLRKDIATLRPEETGTFLLLQTQLGKP
jgi:DNA topoisomerase I